MPAIEIDWDGNEGRQPTILDRGKFSKDVARSYLSTHFVRIDRAGREMWQSSQEDVRFVGVFDIEQALHMLRPLGLRTIHDEKYGQDEQNVFNIDEYLEHRGPLDQTDTSLANIHHKGRTGDGATSHRQIVTMFLPKSQRLSESAFDEAAENCLGYSVRKRGGTPGRPHVLYLQSVTLNNPKWSQSRTGHRETAIVPLEWAEIIRKTLERLLPC